jgi:hypothetical protein
MSMAPLKHGQGGHVGGFTAQMQNGDCVDGAPVNEQKPDADE